MTEISGFEKPGCITYDNKDLRAIDVGRSILEMSDEYKINSIPRSVGHGNEKTSKPVDFQIREYGCGKEI